MRRSTDNWILAALFVLLIVGGFFATAPPARKENTDSTTYNPDPKGVKAFYTLLGERLGYRVARLNKPYTELPRGTRVLIVVQPSVSRGKSMPLMERDYSISDDEVNALTNWVSNGGVAIFFADHLNGLPPVAFFDRLRMKGVARGDSALHSEPVEECPSGRGAVYVFDSRSRITNQGMRDYKNALSIIKLIDRNASKRDLILFDEYHHGYTESRSVWSYVSRQVWIAASLLFIAGLILCHTYGRRFGAVRNPPPSEILRPGYEFVESAARLYQRAHATDLAANALCGSLIRKIGERPGVGANPRVSGLIARCQAGQKPSEQELVEIAREIRKLEEELGLGSIDA